MDTLRQSVSTLVNLLPEWLSTTLTNGGLLAGAVIVLAGLGWVVFHTIKDLLISKLKTFIIDGDHSRAFKILLLLCTTITLLSAINGYPYTAILIACLGIVILLAGVYNRKQPSSQNILISALIITLSISAFFGERHYIDRLQKETRVYVTLSFEGTLSTDKQKLLAISQHFHSTLSEVFRPIRPKVNLLPNELNQDNFNILSFQTNFQNMINWMQNQAYSPDLVLKNEARIFSKEGESPRITLLSQLNVFEDGDVKSLGETVKVEGAFDDIRYLTLKAVIDLLSKLDEQSKFALSEQEKRIVRGKVLSAYSSFLHNREKINDPLLLRDVDKAIAEVDTTHQPVQLLIARYDSLLNPKDLEKHERTSRHARLTTLGAAL